MTVTTANRAKFHPTNLIECLNGEINRGVNDVGIFAIKLAIARLVGKLIMEQSEDWAVQRGCYMALETLAP